MIVVDMDTRLIAAVEALPGNVWDGSAALELVDQDENSAGLPVSETTGHAVCGNGSRRRDFVDAGRRLLP